MNNKKLIFLLIIVSITVLLFTTNNKNTIKNTHKQINNDLDMYLSNKAGNKIAYITANSSIYDKVTNEFYNQKSTINLFTNDNVIIASSDSSSLYNNNKTFSMVGNVEFQISKQYEYKYHLYSDNLTIKIILNDIDLYFNGNINIETNMFIINSEKAEFNINKGVIVFINAYSNYNQTRYNIAYNFKTKSMKIFDDNGPRQQIYF